METKNMDYDMPFMLRFDNVANYENGEVNILDRRIYPREINFVKCKTHKQVAQAIKDMVTQSAGPYTAAAYGMALAAYECKELSYEQQKEFMNDASYTISHARPTTANRMGQITQNAIKVWETALQEGKKADQEIAKDTILSLNRRYKTMDIVGKNLADIVNDGDKILTQCFGETIIGTLFRNLKEQNKTVKVFTAETRPYFQGARLTATCIYQMGFDTTVVTDNMIAYLMKNEKINLFTSAADTITKKGYIANKIGTYQIALLCDAFDVPYYVTGIPDKDKEGFDDIKIEMRDPDEVKSANGIMHTLKKVSAIYPSFDITPPELIKAIVTEKGVFKPNNLDEYFKTETKRFY